MAQNAQETTISSQIYHSRDFVRNQIIEQLKKYLELENVDLTKSSFLSFLVNILSTLTSNLMFYQISTYREFFLTAAQLPESIYNLSSFLGYNTIEASYASVGAFITIPFGFPDSDTHFTIPEGHTFKAGDITFSTYYRTDITVVNNSSVTALITTGNTIYNIPVNVDTTSAMDFSFVLPLRQYKETQQEFQIDSDLKPYQFVTVDVPISGQVASIKVEVKDPDGTSWRLYEEYNSLYLMSSTTYGFVSKKTGFGRRIYFGNGLIGVQPLPGSTVRVTIEETEGTSGNIITGSLINGDRIYNVTQSGVTQIVNYTVTNPSPAVGGKDEEGIEEIRSNSIDSITTLGRLVSQDDYTHTDIVIPNSPIAANSLALLKRSDIKVNEIMLFTTLKFGNDIVPTRNAFSSFDSTSSVSFYLPRGTSLMVGGEKYYTMFDMSAETFYNKVAYYQYIMYQVEQTPLLITGYGSTYNIVATLLEVIKSGNQAIFRLHYDSTESDYDLTSCVMKIVETDKEYIMTNDPTKKYFEYIFDPYTLVPSGQLTYYFTISTIYEYVAQYSSTVIFRKSLDDFMLSNLTMSDSTSMIIYDIPIVKASYYDSINQKDFELQVLQTMMMTMDFSKYRMLTDFTNVKFANTTGPLTGMQRNLTTKDDVIDLNYCDIPLFPSKGDRYIVSGLEGGEWTAQKNKIAQYDGTSWIFLDVVTDDIVYVKNKGYKYIYTGVGGWIIPVYTIPLKLDMEVYKYSLFTGSAIDLAQAIKTAILDYFTSRFGVNAQIFRSEIIDVVQSVDGVDRVQLLKPESNIFFNYDLDKFTQQELLEYGPEYIYFTENDITVKVYG